MSKTEPGQSDNTKTAVSSSPVSTEVPLLETRILVVEDEAVFARAVSKRLERSGYKTMIAGDIKTATKHQQDFSPDLILLDMRLPDGSGLDFLADLRNKQQSNVAVLVMSAYGELEDAVAAMKLAASDYLKKPVDLDELLINVEKVLAKEELNRKLSYSSKRESHAVETVDFLGDCEALQTVRNQVEKIARLTQAADTVPPTVLILGETGTGKDVLARRLHAESRLRDKPFVHVDCASLPKDLIEAELFGHEKGAFTSAQNARTGLIEAAEDGVLFLDEIGEIPLDLQAKLLAVLERRMVRRVGTTQEKPVRAWFIAATNRDLEKLAAAGDFRSDLYYRLNVLNVDLPALRDRGRDVLILTQHFAGRTAQRYGLAKPQLTDSAEQALLDYDWPGNIRELRHIVERAVLLSGGGELTADDFGLTTRLATPKSDQVKPATDDVVPPDVTLDAAERKLIQQALARTHGNVSQAARELGITRMALRYRMKKHDL